MALILSGTDGLSDVDGTAATPAIRGTDANTGMFFPAADTIAFSEGGVEAMRLDSVGNVGIGTSSPLQRFTAVNTGIGGGAPVTTGSAADPNAVARFQTGSVVTDLGAYAAGTVWIQPRLASNYSFNFGMALCPNGGNVGIGTGSPTGNLTVQQASVTTGGPVLSLWNSNASAGNTCGYLRFDSNATARAQIHSVIDSGSPFFGNLIFSTGENTLTERARISSDGNLLVGTTSGSQRLRVQGAQTQDAAWFVTTHTVGSQYAAVSIQRSASTGDMIQFWNQATSAVIGTVSTNNTSVAYNTSSDYRLKNTIAPMTGALAKVAALKPVTYKWNSDGSDGQGFIAHELAEVCPDAVSGAKDAVDPDGKPVYQGIDTSFLVATLTAAIQEQQAIIESLTARVAQLEAK